MRGRDEAIGEDASRPVTTVFEATAVPCGLCTPDNTSAASAAWSATASAKAHQMPRSRDDPRRKPDFVPIAN